MILMIDVKVGSKTAGSYIKYIETHPAENIRIMACGKNTGKAVYISAVIQDWGYEISDFKIENVDKGLKYPLAILMITMRLKNEFKDKN